MGLSRSSSAVVSRGYFIVFEGIDGSGTTTQSRLLASYLREADLPVRWTREPGGTPIGWWIREFVLEPKQREFSYVAELFLYGADRAQHVEEVIQPSLEQGVIVICDRYTVSSLAYQGYGRGLDQEVIKQVNHLAVGQCLPDATIYLDLPARVAWKRRRNRHEIELSSQLSLWSDEDRLELPGEELQKKVAQGYKEIAESDPTALVFDADLEIEQLAKEIRNALRERLPWFPEEKK